VVSRTWKRHRNGRLAPGVVEGWTRLSSAAGEAETGFLDKRSILNTSMEMALQVPKLSSYFLTDKKYFGMDKSC
jgi:hypothetical protein